MPVNISRKLFLSFWLFKMRQERFDNEIFLRKNENNNGEDRHVEVVLVDWAGYSMKRTKQLGNYVIGCGLKPLVEHMALVQAGLSFDVTLIINEANESQRKSIERWRSNYPFIKRTIFRGNQGMDLGAYNEGYQFLKNAGYCGDILFINSSSRGPLEKYWLLRYWRLFRSKPKIGLCGISMNSHTTHLKVKTFRPHIQSFFVYSNMEVLREVFPQHLPGAFFDPSDKLGLISEGEIRLSQEILAAGFGICSNFSKNFVYYQGRKWQPPLGELRLHEPYRMIANQI